MPQPYRPPEQVVAEWIAYYEWLHPGKKPPVGWISRNSKLSPPCVYNHRRKILYTRDKVNRKTP